MNLSPITEKLLDIPYEWTQTRETVTLKFEISNLKKKPSIEPIREQHLELEFEIGGKCKILEFILFDKIDPKTSKVEVNVTNNVTTVLFTLNKTQSDKKFKFWDSFTHQLVKAGKSSKLPSVYSKNKISFDDVEKMTNYITENNLDEEMDINKFYQNIYAGCNEKAKRSAIRSFQLSGGKALDFSGDHLDRDYSKMLSDPYYDFSKDEKDEKRERRERERERYRSWD